MTANRPPASVDESTGEEAAVLPGRDSGQAIENAVETLRRTFASRRTRGLTWRRNQLAGIERLLSENEALITNALAEDMGRSSAETWMGDIVTPSVEAAYARKNLHKWARRRHTRLPIAAMPGRGWYEYEPLGVVLVIGPWNYPLNLTLGPLVGAIAAGNCVILKPSEYSPATSRLLARLVPHYLDNDAVKVVEGDGQVTQDLLARGLDHVFFTGGIEIGKLVMAGAARQLTPVTLELGGKSPVIVTQQANLEVAARRIAWSKFMNSGQTCIAPDYVLVDRTIKEEFLARLITAVKTFRSAELDSGMRIINRRHHDRLVDMIASSGGMVAFGGRADGDNLTIQPTIVLDPNLESKLMSNEIFGPILPTIAVDSMADALEFVSARPKPLAAYLFSNSRSERRKMLSSISAGAVVVNHAVIHSLVPQLPFGGVGGSGFGSYHGKWGFEQFSHRKAVLSKRAFPDLSIIYPPYSTAKLRMMRRIF
ncbi:aldehyde dehydrogenase family protein [Nocardia sp. SC052]|uniref:aldehyde dehydrogenase family protein n=1 Tax=Nocardia sichangensis TaxID=3385975 RepID=UPI0039A07AAE